MRPMIPTAVLLTIGLILPAMAQEPAAAPPPEVAPPPEAAPTPEAAPAAEASPPTAAAPATDTSDPDPLTVRVDPVETTTVKLDRGDWPRIAVGPADGRTVHHPTYVIDPRCWGDEPDPVMAQQVEWQLAEAMDGSMSEDWSCDNTVEALAAPLVAAGELAVLPISAIIAPPWTTVTTPAVETEEDASDDDKPGTEQESATTKDRIGPERH